MCVRCVYMYVLHVDSLVYSQINVPISPRQKSIKRRTVGFTFLRTIGTTAAKLKCLYENFDSSVIEK